MKKITGNNYIACKKTSEGSKKYHSTNPKTLEKSKTSFTDATQKEINKAVEKAEKALKEIKQEKIPVFLKEISKEIQKLGDQLIEITDQETALGENRLKNERTRTCDQLNMFADFIEQKKHQEIIKENSTPDVRRMLIPIGPVAVFPASNFPFAFGILGGDTASALAAGCPVIVKAHPSHPKTSELFAQAAFKAIQKTNFPKGTFSMIHGKNTEVSKKLILHPKIQSIGFTGSLSAGRKIYNLAATREKPIPVYAEMGSINPIFITHINKNTAEQIADSITLGVGQFCTKPGLVFTTKKTESIIPEIVERIKNKKTGTLLNQNIKNNLVKKVEYTKKIQNLTVLTGGSEVKNKLCFQNTIILTDKKTYIKNKKLKEEHFGPVAIFVKCKDNTDFVEVAEKLDGQLTSTIHMKNKDIKENKVLFDTLINKVGRIIINSVPTGVKVCPAMHHGGPYPATTDIRSTSVGMYAVKRFLRPVCFQDVPTELLPDFIK